MLFFSFWWSRFENKNSPKTTMQNSFYLTVCHIAWNNQKLPCQERERQAKGVWTRISAENIACGQICGAIIKESGRSLKLWNFVTDHHEDFQYQQLVWKRIRIWKQELSRKPVFRGHLGQDWICGFRPEWVCLPNSRSRMRENISRKTEWRGGKFPGPEPGFPPEYSWDLVDSRSHLGQ